MIYLSLPQSAEKEPRKLPFYLAMEEYAARRLEGDYFFMWQVDPTVIYGRNQVPEAELDMAYCDAHHIEYYRRKSGGGCVYADRNNIMFAHIADCRDVTSTFADYTGAVAAMLRKLGIADASRTGRNDILIGDRKVSGYAFYHAKNAQSGRSRAIVHGTMLYDADTATMSAALTPSGAKLAAKGVASVRQRVTTIREHCDISLADFMAFARRHLCSGERTLTSAEIAGIERMEQAYYDPAWLRTRYTDRTADAASTRIPGVGEISVDLRLKERKIESVALTGDFFSDAEATRRMLEAVGGLDAADTAAIAGALARGIDRAIPGLPAAELAALIGRAAMAAIQPADNPSTN